MPFFKDEGYHFVKDHFNLSRMIVYGDTLSKQKLPRLKMTILTFSTPKGFKQMTTCTFFRIHIAFVTFFKNNNKKRSHRS